MARPKTRSPHDRTTHDTKLAVLAIAVDPELQVRTKLDRVKLEDYARAYGQGQPFPPLLVAHSAAGYVLLDGFHRHAAALKAGIPEVPCRIVWADPEEWPWLAAEANLSHGLPYKAAEVREVFRRYVQAGKHRKGTLGFQSYREIALAALKGTKTHTTVRNWMEKDFPRIFAAMGAADAEDEPASSFRPERSATSRAEWALAGFDEVAARSRTITDPEARTTIVNALRSLITELEAQGLSSDPDDDLPF